MADDDKADDDNDLILDPEAGGSSALDENEPAIELTIDEAELDAALDAVVADESGQHDSACGSMAMPGLFRLAAK